MDKKQFEETVAKHKGKVVLVDFFAEWCGPCRMVGKVLDTIEKTDKDVSIVRIDCDKEGELSDSFNIRSIPTMFIFGASGKQFKRIEGAAPATMLKDLIEQAKSV